MGIKLFLPKKLLILDIHFYKIQMEIYNRINFRKNIDNLMERNIYFKALSHKLQEKNLF